MADVTPFRGLLYDRSVCLDDVVAPPYDVITVAQAAHLRGRSPFNAVHLDMPVGPGETPTGEAYAAAAGRLSAWRRAGVVRRDDTPHLYVVDQTYVGPDGRERTRRGFVARLRLADLSEGVVRPHERTHSGPKVDRLRLYRAAHADLSQIFLLVPDDDGAVSEALAGAAAGEARGARDPDGNLHSIAPLGGGAAQRIAAALRERPVYIADGHHRYETALAYRDERRAAGDNSADTLMVYLCSLSDPGLTVFPTHRLLKGVDLPPLDVVQRRLEPLFETVAGPVRGEAAARALLEDLPARADPGRVFGLYFAREDACLVVRAREPQATRRLLDTGVTPELAALSVTVLHDLVLRDVLGMDPADEERQVHYVKSVPDAMKALAGGAYEAGAFLNATAVDQVRAVADRGEVMPQKSTYFYPKLLTGLVFDPLD